MPAPGEIDVGQARAFLAAHLGPGVTDVEWVGEGAWSRCFGFRHDGRDLVIQFGRLVEDFEKDRRAAAFASPSRPIPDVVEIGPALGGYFAISSRLYGEPLESLDAGEWKATLPALLRTLDALRSVDLAGTGGYGDWDGRGTGTHATWRDFLLAADVDDPGHRTHGWRPRLVASSVGDEVFRAGFARLTELAALDAVAGVERSLVHCDLLNRNVLVHRGEVTGLLDWGCSLYGDFLYDIAQVEFWEPWYPALAACGIRVRAEQHYESSSVAVDGFADRLQACLIHIGLVHQAYTALVGRLDDLHAITNRLRSYLD